MAADPAGSAADPIVAAAIAILDGFRAYRERFGAITRAAKSRFERAAWLEVQIASIERIEMYKVHTQSVVDAVRARAGTPTAAQWRAIKRAYTERIRRLPDGELAETFFNSIVRDLSTDWHIDDSQMFVWSELPDVPVPPVEPIYTCHSPERDAFAAVRDILLAIDFALPWQHLERDISNILRSLAEARPEIRGASGLSVEILRSVFYRNKGAYLVGRLRYEERAWPVVLPILIDESERALYVDTLICDEDELSVVFSFTRSYFMVDAANPAALIDYLQALLPGKMRAELYASIGMHKHGKTEFYRGFLTHLARSKDQFVIAPGVKGMVMSVFTLPSYQTVFKVIKDEFAPQKDITREAVKQKYYTVKTHDRVGRMADTQEFDHFAFPRARFSNELIEELRAVATSSVSITDELVTVSHLYTERLMIPLNLYIESASEEQLRDALDEYGNAIKQLAAANIFPGDMLLKNFGVTRHGRVVFYDYDEIGYLTDVNFRDLPSPRTPEEEIAAEPWFTVGSRDVFPQEFRRFLFGRPGIKRIFTEMHGELFDPAYWRGLQQAIRDGKVMDVFPYRRKKRFARRGDRSADAAQRGD